MISFDSPSFAIASPQLSLSACTYKMPSWWVVSWLVGTATQLKKRRNFSEEKENAASWQLAASRNSLFGPCLDRGLTQLTPTGRSVSGSLNRQNTTPGQPKENKLSTVSRRGFVHGKQ
jgi:hypothetical protein